MRGWPAAALAIAFGAEVRRDELPEQGIYAGPGLFNVVGNPWVTRLGQWLRRSSMDELPRFVNVLLGDMSLVGLGPPLPSEVSLYDAHHSCRST